MQLHALSEHPTASQPDRQNRSLLVPANGLTGSQVQILTLFFVSSEQLLRGTHW